MSELKVNKISPKTACGTTTLGDSGDTFTIPAGVTITNNGTQTGFGRTGTVNWQTGSIKTGDFTAANGEGYFINTTSGTVTVTLPSSPSAGNIVAVADYAGTSATNQITINRNSSPFEGGTENGVIITNRQTATFVYVDGTQGWVVVNSNDASFVAPAFVAATGGNTVATVGDFKVHTFTGPGTLCVSNAGNAIGSNTVDYLVVAGGGGGGRGCSHGGGGGAGGYRESSGAASGCYSVSPLGAGVSALPVTATGYPITVGGGGAAASPSTSPNKIGSSGSNSIFSTRTSTGGGGGAGWNNTGGAPGGSGGGAACNSSPTNVGTGNTPPVSPPQGNPGGASQPNRMGGGGGALEAGNTDGQGYGGDGAASTINNTPTTRAGGGSGGGSSCSSTNIAGGDGGGGQGSGSGNGGAATANTGGGGGGSYNPGDTGGAGGSGIVIIRYKFQ
jgi:hypothetical protein